MKKLMKKATMTLFSLGVLPIWLVELIFKILNLKRA